MHFRVRNLKYKYNTSIYMYLLNMLTWSSALQVEPLVYCRCANELYITSFNNTLFVLALLKPYM